MDVIEEMYKRRVVVEARWLRMLPSLTTLPHAPPSRPAQRLKRNDSDDDGNGKNGLFDELPTELQNLVFSHTERDCETMGKWCQLRSCDEAMWERACVHQGFPAKPDRFSWRVWFARNCQPNLAKRMDKELITASIVGDVEAVRSLLDRGADIHNDANNAVRQACAEGHLEVVRLLYERGANIHIYDDTPILMASAGGHLAVVGFLLDHGADGDEALAQASGKGHLELMKYLLDRGVDIHNNEDLALTTAAAKGQVEAVKLLLERGANIHVKNDYVFWLAQINNYTELEKVLLEHVEAEKMRAERSERYEDFLFNSIGSVA